MALITLTAGGTSITFPSGTSWTDQHAWQPVEQSMDRGLDGALIVQAMAIPSGRPITLAGVESGAGAMPLSDLQQLEAWAAIPLQQMTLAILGQTYTVMWRHQDKPALDSTPLFFVDNPDADDLYQVTAKFMVTE
jgi:hypothetical protein